MYLIFISDNCFKNQDCMPNVIFPPLEMCLPFQKEHDMIQKLFQFNIIKKFLRFLNMFAET